MSTDPSQVAARLVKKAMRCADDRAEELDENVLKPIKQFARQAELHVALIAEETFGMLAHKKSSQVRFLALQLCSCLWTRSAAFRHILLDRLVPEFIQLVGVEQGTHPLPPPASWAERLPKRALELVESWHATHGQLEGYGKVAVARRYLRAVDENHDRGGLRNGGASAALEAQLAEQRAARWQEKYSELRAVAHASLAEMRRGADALETCLRILAPSLEEGEASGMGGVNNGGGSSSSGGGTAGGGGSANRGMDAAFDRVVSAVPGQGPTQRADEDTVGREEGEGGGEEEEEEEGGEEELAYEQEAPFGGVGAAGGSIEFSLGEPEQRTEADRAALMDALHDAHAEARKRHLPTLRSWQLTLSRVTLPPPERPAQTALLQRATAMRSRLRELMVRAEPLVGSSSTSRAIAGREEQHEYADCEHVDGEEGEDDDDDDEFEPVATDLKPGYEPNWVDPDAGWEKPPPEAMRSPRRHGGREEEEREGGESGKVALTFGGGVEGSRTAEGADESVRGCGQGSRRCSAPRRDGSLCTRHVPEGGVCEFHGAWMERERLSGLPLSPAEGSVWALVVSEARRSVQEAGAGGDTDPAEQGQKRGWQGGPSADDAKDGSNHAERGARHVDGVARKRPRSPQAADRAAASSSSGGDGGGGNSSRAALGDTSSVGVPAQSASAASASAASASAASAEAAAVAAAADASEARRGRKAPVSGRQRLKQIIAKGERRAAATMEAFNAAANEKQHRMRQMW